MKSYQMTCHENEIILTPIVMKTMNKKTANEVETAIMQVFIGIKVCSNLKTGNLGYVM